MDSLTFVAEIVKALAWPITVIVAVCLLRRPIVALVPYTRSLKYKDLLIEFGREIGELRDQAARELPPAPIRTTPVPSAEDRLLSLATVSPNAAILEAWQVVERASLSLLRARQVEIDASIPARYKRIERLLDSSGLVDRKKIKIFSDLRQLRNRIAHAHGVEATSGQALEFIEVSLALAKYLEERTQQERSEPHRESSPNPGPQADA